MSCYNPFLNDILDCFLNNKLVLNTKTAPAGKFENRSSVRDMQVILFYLTEKA
jgi:hypothetical protein